MSNYSTLTSQTWRGRIRFTLAATLGGWLVITIFYIFGLIPTTLTPETTLSPHEVIPELTTIDSVANPSIIPEATVTNENTLTGIAHNPRQPIRITIPEIGTDAPIYNPESTNVAALDNFLTRGAVRYPGSGLPTAGNMFIFGHSSNWPVVHNQAYKTFNGIGTLENGDEIFVYTIDKVYKYVVSSVKLVDSSQAYVSFDASDTMLTLSTCNSFGTKEERFVVEAKLVSTLSS